MKNILQDIIKFLLEKACPSIQSRVRWELLGQSRLESSVSNLQAEILKDTAVANVLASQDDDGWLGKGFHGYGCMEAAIRLLCEKDLDPENQNFHQAINALKTRTNRFYVGIGKVGDILDEGGFGGIEMIRAALLAQAGEESESLVQAQISEAILAFKGITEQDNIDAFVKPHRGKMTFRQGVRWPSIYHFRLLAYSQCWRSPENMEMLAHAVSKMVEWSPLPEAYVLYHGQMVAPGSFGLHDLVPELNSLEDADWMIWFQRMALFARLGVVNRITKLETQVSELRILLEDGSGKFTKPLTHPYFRKWGAYTGMMLEKNWRNAERRICDLTFRSILILHYRES